jgi:hypothetical protein
MLTASVGESGQTKRVAETKALIKLRVDVELGAVPQAQAEERGRRRGIAGLVGSRKAVRAFIGRIEVQIALLDEGELPVDIPTVGVDRPPVGKIAGGCGRARPAKLPVEPEAKAMEVYRRRVISGARREFRPSPA